MNIELQDCGGYRDRLREIYKALKPYDGIKYAAARFHTIHAGKNGIEKGLTRVRWAQAVENDPGFILAAQGFAEEGEEWHADMSAAELAEYFAGLKLAEKLILSVEFDLAQCSGGAFCVCVECMVKEKPDIALKASATRPNRPLDAKDVSHTVENETA